MPDVIVSRHADRWSVTLHGDDSALEEHSSREAAEMAARRLAAGGTVSVREDDATGLEENAAGDTTRNEATPAPRGVCAPEGARDPQAGL